MNSRLLILLAGTLGGVVAFIIGFALIYTEKPDGVANNKETSIPISEGFVEKTDTHDLLLPVKPEKVFVLKDKDIEFVDGGKLYLVILGHVFDVTKGSKHYGPGSGYHGFIGRDGSRAFISGDFTEAGLISDIEGLAAEDYDGLVNWIKFYQETYDFVGVHEGKFYDSNGVSTSYMKNTFQWIEKSKQEKADKNKVKERYPPCNVQWSGETGTKFWCSTKSGGVERTWEGFPYQFTEDEGKTFRCACIKSTDGKDPKLKPYENCSEDRSTCYVKSN